VSSTDGVDTDKAAGIWKSLAENPETILIGAYRRKKKEIEKIGFIFFLLL
jgi:hypothetical protein